MLRGGWELFQQERDITGAERIWRGINLGWTGIKPDRIGGKKRLEVDFGAMLVFHKFKEALNTAYRIFKNIYIYMVFFVR